MSEERPWMHKVFSRSELSELISAANRIIWDDDNGIVVNISMSNNQCMDFIHHWHITRDEEDVLDVYESIAYLEDFLFDLVDFLEKHLDNENDNWREQYYGEG